MPDQFEPRRSIALLLALAVLWGIAATHAACANSTPRFQLTEPLGRAWTNERVRFPLKGGGELPVRGAALINELGRAVPYEILHEGSAAFVELLTDLPAGATHWFEFEPPSGSVAGSDLVVEETAAAVTLANAHGGVRLNKAPRPGEGPISALKLSDGTWLPVVQTIAGQDPITSTKIAIGRRGPVVAAATVTATFASGVTWQTQFELQGGEAAVVVHETWSAWDHPEFDLAIDLGAAWTGFYYRAGQGTNQGRVALAALTTEAKAFELEPWLHWWIAERRGTWVAVFGESETRVADALVVSALQADSWITEADGTAGHHIEPVRVSVDSGRIGLHFPGHGAGRAWLAALVPKAGVIERPLIGTRVAPPPQRLRIKYSDIVLDQIKDWTLEWPHAPGVRANMMLTPEDAARIKAQLLGADDAARIKRLPLNEQNLGQHIQYLLRTDDPATAQAISSAAVPALRAALSKVLDQGDLFSFGFAPNLLREVLYGVHLSDIALSSPWTTEFDKAAIRRLAAALTYELARPDYWSQRRGYSANPNMNSMVAGFRGMLACLIGDHPQAPSWLGSSVAELFDHELMNWSDENGGWLEPPHYALGSQDAILAVLLCARGAGRPDLIRHPRVRLVSEWLAKTTTPPDIHFDGRRFLAPIGDTFIHEPSGWFGTMAFVMRDIDPEFSARMQWMHRASGSPQAVAVGGFAPYMAPEQVLFKDPSLPASAPHYGSELFPETGAVLRAHFGTGRETQMLVISGTNHAHYGEDSGSITFWGKGRLVANAWGYGEHHPAAHSSMVEGKFLAGEMKTTRFETGDVIDSFAGTSGAWTRSLTLIKDADPLGPNYALIDDSIADKRNGTWRLWLTAGRVEATEWGVRVSGFDDVDTDVVFLDGVPAGLGFETKTLKSASSIKGAVETTQTAIVAPMPGPNGHIRVLLWPRLKNEAGPKVSVTAQGRRIDIETEAGTETVLYGRGATTLDEGGISFHGTTGLVRSRGGQLLLSVEGGGRLQAQGHAIESGTGKTQAWPN